MKRTAMSRFAFGAGFMAAVLPAACAEVVDNGHGGAATGGIDAGFSGMGGGTAASSGSGGGFGTGGASGLGGSGAIAGSSATSGSGGAAGSAGTTGGAGLAGSGASGASGASGSGASGSPGMLGTGGSIPACSLPGYVLCDDFEDGNPDGWVPTGGAWLLLSEGGGGASGGGGGASGASGALGTAGASDAGLGGAAQDAGALDASVDAGPDPDSGPDGGAADSGVDADSGLDAGPAPDASVGMDSGQPDSGSGGSVSVDAGADAAIDGGPAHVFSDGPFVYQGGGGTFLSTAGSTSFTDQTVEAKLKVIAFGGTSASYRAGIVARYTPGSSNYYFFALDARGNLVLLRASSVPSGASGSCAAVASGLSPNSWFTLRMQVSGPLGNVHIRTFLNGAQVHDCTTTSSTAASGMIGLYTYGSGTTARFDNVKVSTP